MNKTDFSFNLKIGINYLLKSIRKDGSFLYEINYKTGRISNSYNILRHAGALYVLYKWQNHSKKYNDSAKLELATTYLKERIKPLNNNPGICCVVEKATAKSGGAGLAILVFVERYKISSLSDDLNIMRGLGKFIIWMQESSGKFKSKLFYEENSFSNFESLYYPGEAILALIRLYQVDPNPVWIKSAEMGIEFLIKNPVLKKNGTHGHNHWLATALAEYYKINKNIKVYNELWSITTATINFIDKNCVESIDNIVYSSAEISTRGETILATLNLELKLDRSTEILKLTNVLYKAINYCLRFQIRKNLLINGFNVKGGIRERKRKHRIRIDYVQHLMQILILPSVLTNSILEIYNLIE